MRRVLLLLTVMIAGCTFLEKQSLACGGFFAKFFQASAGGIDGLEPLSGGAPYEAALLADTLSPCVSSWLPEQRDDAFYRSDPGIKTDTVMLPFIIKKSYDIKSLRPVPFKLRI
ncbi:hypothetical protein LJC14_01385 [Treponema sp. OttesenSCG-928-L16]|nr:hypothetical protein [Treponema sp. OttesenSCG-928-L16]